MKLAFPSGACALLLLLGAFAGPARATVADAGFVPDSTVILRVGNRVTTARDFVEEFYSAWAEDRPNPDSTGRREFLDQITDKEIMATVALRNPRPMDFGDRLLMRQHTDRVLSNVLFQRTLVDSDQVSDAQVAALRHNYSSEKHLQRILFEDLAKADRVREALLQKRVKWEDARRAAQVTMKDSTAGELGWVSRTRLSPADAAEIFDLEPGEISQPHEGSDGVSLVRAIDRRGVTPPPFTQYDRILRSEIRATTRARRMNDIHRELGLKVELTFDEPNIAWAARRFSAPTKTAGEMVIGVGKLPTFAPQDTGRVLARWRDGHMSIHDFMYVYMQIHPYLRTPVNTPTALRQKVETFALEPYRARLAIERGLDRDPLALRMIEHRREAILVDHLYQDSIQAKVRTSEAQERKFYKENVARFITYPTVRFAGFSRPSQASAESLAAQLRAGMRLQDAMASDSMRFGRANGFISQYTTQNEGQPFYKLLMEELKPGQVGVESTDRGWWVIQSLSFDPGHQLTFDEARLPIQESLANMAAQDLLDRFLARHRRGLRIEAHPELVTRIDFSDPIERR
jgi:hypothetical protein